MTQNKEMPDVLFVDRNPWTKKSNGFLSWKIQKEGDIEYIRHGAPSPWIDPKVQPIPDGLRGDSEIVVRYVGPIYRGRIHISVKSVCRARMLFDDELLLGYIILPE